MIRPGVGSGRLRFVLAPLVAVVMALGCGEFDPPQEPDVPAGRIQGHVYLGGLEAESTIEAKLIVESGSLSTRFQAEPDSTGAYVLDLPAGRYIISLDVSAYGSLCFRYAASGLYYSGSSPDTLDVAPSVDPLIVDFDLSGVVATVMLPEGYEGQEAYVYLYHSDDYDSRYDDCRGRAEIAEGRADVEIPGVLPGDYRVKLILGDGSDGETIWWPATRDPEEADWFTVEADSPLFLTCNLTSPPGRIEGRINAAPEILAMYDSQDLTLVTPDSLVVVGDWDVEDDGSFGIDLLLAGPVKLRLDWDEIEPWYGGEDFASATTLDIVAGETISDLVFDFSALRLNVTCSGFLSGSMYLDFYDPSGETRLYRMHPYVHYGMTIVPNLPPGEYLMHVPQHGHNTENTPWHPQWFDRATSPATADLVTLAAGDIQRIDLVLDKGGSILGHFDCGVDTTATYYVIAVPVDDPETYTYDYDVAPETGYAITGLSDGPHKLAAYVHTFSYWSPSMPLPEGTVWYPGTEDEAEAGILYIENACDVTDVDFGVD